MLFNDLFVRLKRYIGTSFDHSSRLMRHEGGATAIEFALVCVFAALITIAAMNILTPTIIDSFPKAIKIPWDN